jgi:hypothetical protein
MWSGGCRPSRPPDEPDAGRRENGKYAYRTITYGYGEMVAFR